MANSNLGTSLKVTLECGDVIDSLDKSAAKIEEFSDRGAKAVNSLSSATTKMGTANKRVYDQLTRDLQNHQSAVSKLAQEYEKLRAKQQSGADMTRDELARLKNLQKEYKNHAGAIATCAKELEAMNKKVSFDNKSAKNLQSVASAAKKMRAAEVQLNTATPMSIHLLANLGLAADALSAAFNTAKSAIQSFGLDMQQGIAQIAGMKSNTEDALEVYREFNNAWRDTNYSSDSVQKMARDFMNLGNNAKEAARLVNLVADATAALGGKQDMAEGIADTMKEMWMTNEFESRDVKKIQKYGLDVGKIFGEAFNMEAKDAIEAIGDQKITGRQSFAVLRDYFQDNYAGSMANSKNNVNDIVGDIEGNMQTAAGEIGNLVITAFKDAFKSSDLSKIFIDASQAAVDFSRSLADTGNVYNSLVKAVGEDAAQQTTNWIQAAGAVGSVAMAATGVTQVGIALKDVYETEKSIEAVGLFAQLSEDAKQYESTIQDCVDKISDIVGSDPIGIGAQEKKQAQIITQMQTDAQNALDKTKKAMESVGTVMTSNLDSEAEAIANAHSLWQQREQDLAKAEKALDSARQAANTTAPAFNAGAQAWQKYNDAQDAYIQAQKTLAQAQNEATAAQTAYQAVLASSTQVTATSNKVVVQAAIAQKGLNAEIIANAGVTKAATAATWSQIGAMWKLKIAQLASAAAAVKHTMATAAQTLAMQGFAGAARAAAAALWAMIAPMLKILAIGLATPIGAAVAAFVALGAAVYGTYKYLDSTENKFKSVGEEARQTAQDIAKINFGNSPDTPSANADAYKKLAEAGGRYYSNSSETGKKLKELADEADSLEKKLAISAITMDDYTQRMSKLNAEADKLKNTLAKQAASVWNNKDLINGAADLKQMTITADNFGEALEKIEKVDKASGFALTFKNQAEDLKKTLPTLQKQIEAVKDEIATRPDDSSLTELNNKLAALEGQYSETQKSIEDLTQASTFYKDLCNDLSQKQIELTNQLNRGAISEDEYNAQMEVLIHSASRAQSAITDTTSAVVAINDAMANGIITAKQYSAAIASIAHNSAQMAIAQKGLQDAIQSGDVEGINGYTRRLESLAESTKSIVFNNDDFKVEQKKAQATNPKDYGELGAGKGGDKNKGKSSGKSTDPKDYTKQINDQYNKLADLRKKVAESITDTELEAAKAALSINSELAGDLQKIVNDRKASELDSINSIYKARVEYSSSIEKLEKEMETTSKEYQKWKEDAAKEDSKITENEKKSREELYNVTVKRIKDEMSAETDLYNQKLKSAAIKSSTDTFNSQKELASQFETYATQSKLEKQISDLEQQRHNAAIQALTTQKQYMADYYAAALANGQTLTDTEIANAEKLASVQAQKDLDKVNAIQQQIDLMNQLNTVEQTAMESLSDGITNWITGVSTFGDVVRSVVADALSTMINYYVQLMLQETLFRNLKKTGDTADTARTAAANAKIIASDTAVYTARTAALTAYTAAATSSIATVTAAQVAANASMAASMATLAAAKYAAMIGPGGPAIAAAEIAASAATITATAVAGMKDGGLVVGPGTSRSDSIPTMLSNGEYVLSAKAVRAVGIGNLDAINSGSIPHRADGGLVGNADISPIAAESGTTFNLSVNAMDAKSFETWLNRGALQKIKQSLKDDQRKFNSSHQVF